MEEAPVEPDMEEAEEAPKKARGPLVKILVVVVAAAVAGVAVWALFLSNAAPVATFTFETDNLRVRVEAEGSADADGRIASYAWDFGDGGRGSGIRAAHNYSQEGDFAVTLTVTDNRGGTQSVAQTVHVEILPKAFFIARTLGMTVEVDASGSASELGPISTYAWDFGDGATATGVTATNTYSTAGRRTVTLTVTDSTGAQATATRYVSPSSTTVDILVDRFFESACPYRNYWEFRRDVYGDRLLRNAKPCTDFYPWVLFTDFPDVNPSFVYTVYRLDAKVRNHPGYNLTDPVMWPVFNRSVVTDPTSYLTAEYTFGYVDDVVFEEFNGTLFKLADWVKSDGFGHIVQGNLTMDFTTSKRIFNVSAATPADAQAWWDLNTAAARSAGSLERNMSAWIVNTGNGKYDIYNGFEWFYTTDITDLKATVDTDGTTHVRFLFSGWGFEVLQARFFYWGKSDYRKAVCVQGPLDPSCPATQPYGAIQPQGWLPMESCWCEQATVSYTIGNTSLDLDFEAFNGYHVSAWTNWGLDGVPKTSDDLPSWTYEPVNMDYVPRAGYDSPGGSVSGFPNSELRYYENLRAFHGTPGSYSSGELYEFLVGKVRWAFNAGSTLTVVLPTFSVPWYDPHDSFWDAAQGIGVYDVFMSPMTLRFVEPDGTYFLWDGRGKVLSFAGPHSWGVSSTELPLQGWPYLEFAPEEMPTG
ncbi:MAG: PKD domain-containing protein [Methanobacteriota archaeon]